MVKLSHFTGIDIPIPELGLVLHQPSITELSYLGTDEIIFSVIKFITLKKENYFLLKLNILSDNEEIINTKCKLTNKSINLWAVCFDLLNFVLYFAQLRN